MKPTGFYRFCFNKEPSKWCIKREVNSFFKEYKLKKDARINRLLKRSEKHNFKEYIKLYEQNI